ncbi:hypothetical protein SAMN05518800_2311 [Variovorax sp. YR752]|uniref:HNH endonuclease n=1 Tax=Variovorax sp. YR752 TaxID=1884383 RepID=UPI000BD3FF96|nr:HNH endonuclease [Variovorax sp. YR752]SOD26232.1 hypothetical protein SAMN05518800_2311 [Variovorax sp. YR752]
MTTEDRFKQAVISTLAKRAANQCSNPDCGAITSGPSSTPLGSVNVGEAAHIYGANPGSARYDAGMASSDRSAISNAVWLCGNCHKLIDDDPLRYPAGLLFEWQRNHEQIISEQIGKAGFKLRQKYEARHLEEFGRLSYLAERLILEKDDFWEYRLTTEVLRFEMAPVLQRWSALKRGLYVKPSSKITQEEFIAWFLLRIGELTSISGAFSELINHEFARAWGEPGVPGNDMEIVATARLFSEMCQSALNWEETVRFVSVDEAFEEVRDLFIGTAGRIIEEAAKLPTFLSEIFTKDPVNGKYKLELVLSVPDGWNDEIQAALGRVRKNIL